VWKALKLIERTERRRRGIRAGLDKSLHDFRKANA